MSTTKEQKALKLALEALNTPSPSDSYPPLWRAYETTINSAIKACEEALAQPKQKMTYQQAAQLINEMKSQPEQDTCKGCNGNGVVGNILDTDTCPFCKGSGIEAQPEQRSVSEHLEPVAWLHEDGDVITDPLQAFQASGKMEPLYTTPPPVTESHKRPSRSDMTWVNATPWRGLTDEEINIQHIFMSRHEMVRYFEAKLKAKNERKEKNNGT